MATIADTSVILYAVQSLDKVENDPIQTSYELHFHDLPSGERGVMVADGEADAVNLFASWLVADETDIGKLEPYVKRLYDTFGERGKFLP